LTAFLIRYGQRALKKMLTEILFNSTNALIDATDEEYSNTIQVIDRHLAEKMSKADDGDDLEDFLEASDEDANGEQTKDKFMYDLLTRSCESLARNRYAAIKDGRSIDALLKAASDGTETMESIKPKIDAEIAAAKEAGLRFNVMCK
jgi:hypothetical protein